MQARHQLTLWVSIVFVLGLILWNRLHANLATDAFTGERQSDVVQMELANLFGTTPQNFISSSDETSLKKGAVEKTPPARLRGSTGLMGVYYVREHDNLWRIARAHNLDVETLMSVNQLESPGLIHRGQALKIPSQRGILYTVQRNDTLQKIARRYRVALQEIINANAIANADCIQIGTALFIPGAK